MKYPEPLLKARLIKRYKRFLADVILDDGTEMTIHTANTGSMNGCAIPGSTIWISNSHNPKRKYLYSWEISSTEHGKLIGINTILANKLAKEAIEKGFISELSDVSEIATEVPYGAEKSRIDLLVRQKNGQPAWPIEARAASMDNGMIFYLVGLNKQPIEIVLSGPKEVTGWKDLISGEDGQGNTLEISPLDVRILKLEFEDSLGK